MSDIVEVKDKLLVLAEQNGAKSGYLSKFRNIAQQLEMPPIFSRRLNDSDSV